MITRFYSTCISLCVTFLISGSCLAATAMAAPAAKAVTAPVATAAAASAGRQADCFAVMPAADGAADVMVAADAASAADTMERPAADTSLFGQADALYQAGRYFESAIVWERVLFEGRDSALLLRAVLGKVQCLKQEKKFDQAVTFLESWQGYPFPDSGLIRVQSQLILCTYMGGHFENVLSLVDRWPVTHQGVQADDRLLVLKILSLNELRRWAEAANDYHRVIAGVHTDTTLTDYYAHLPKLKSEAKAEKLSTFIPGAGQFYAGKPADALFSIAIQAAGIYFGVLSFEQHYYLSAWLIGAALFGAFHMGGVHRAVVLVQRYNRRQMLAFNEKVREQLLNVISAKTAAR